MTRATTPPATETRSTNWRSTDTVEVTEAVSSSGRRWARIEARSMAAMNSVLDAMRAASAVVGEFSRVRFGEKRIGRSERTISRATTSGGSDVYVETIVAGYWLSKGGAR